MRKRRRSWPLVLVPLVACAELRTADTSDGGTPEPDGATTTTGDGRDAAAPDVNVGDGGPGDAAKDAEPPACDGPCPPEPLATGLLQATAITVDQNNIYFAIESGNGTVFQCPKTGCPAPASMIVLGSGYATSIAVDATRVYWGDFSAGKLVACNIGGCSQQPTELAPGQTFIRGVSSDGTMLYWSTTADGGSIMRCGLGSCTPQAVATGTGTVIDVAADQGKVFWVDLANKSVRACGTAPCAAPATLGPGTHDVRAHAGKVYWVNGTAKNVVSCSSAGCAGTPLTIGSSTTPSNPVSDGVNVYWRDDLFDEIYKCPVGGCAPGPQIVATKQKGQPGGQLALDGQYLYWTTSSGVYRVRK